MERNAVVIAGAAALLAAVLGFSYGTMWNGGCRGMTAAGAVSGCAEFVLYRYQTFIGIGGAIAAALITVKPVWRQLNEMIRQTEGQTLDYFRRRSAEIDREQTLIYQIASSLDILANTLVALATTRLPAFGGSLILNPTSVVRFKGAEIHMNEMIMKFDQEIGPLWGSKQIHDARARVKEDAQRFSVTLGKFSARAEPNAEVSDAEFDAIGRELAPLKTSVFEAATIVHQGLVAERVRIGQRISSLEAKL
jgi:hypothetical protein